MSRAWLWRAACGIAVLLMTVSPAPAQYEEDEQTGDYADQDQRYLERYTEKAEEPAPTAPDAEEDDFLEFVDRLIRDRNYKAANGKHCRVQTDDPRLDARGVTGLLDGFHEFFGEFWTDVELEPYDKTSRIYLFYSFYKFNQLLGADFRFSSFRPKGHYGYAFDAITLHTDGDGTAELPETLIHETAHQLVDRRLSWQAGRPPIWVSEGLAMYFGHTYRDVDRRFHAGVIGGKNAIVFKGGRVEKPQSAKGRLQIAKKGLKTAADQEGSLIEGLVRVSDPAGFYGEDVDLHYGASWMLVHFLLHGDDGEHRAGFVRYLTREGAGQGGADALFREIEIAPQEIDARLLKHIKGLDLK